MKTNARMKGRFADALARAAVLLLAGLEALRVLAGLAKDALELAF